MIQNKAEGVEPNPCRMPLLEFNQSYKKGFSYRTFQVIYCPKSQSVSSHQLITRSRALDRSRTHDTNSRPTMSDTLVTNLDTSELKAIGAVQSEAELKQLLIDAKLADEEDRLLTIRQALKKYKPAVFWAMFLSVSCRERTGEVHHHDHH